MGYHLTTSPDQPATRSHASPKTHTPLPRLQERGHRFYMPSLGRWVNRDPIGEWSVLKGLLERTLPRRRRIVSWLSQLPPYLSVYNRPIDHFDPDGLYGNPISGPDGPAGPSDPYPNYPIPPNPPSGPGPMKCIAEIVKVYIMFFGNAGVARGKSKV